jgi:hypothetical protein
MKRVYLKSRAALVAVCSLAAVISFAGMARAITDTVFKYSSPKKGFYAIHHLAMSPDNTESTTGYSNVGDDRLTVNATSCFNSGINLPQGATMTAVTIWYANSSSSVDDVQALLWRKTLSDGSSDLIANKIFTGHLGYKAGVLPLAPGLTQVNNQQHVYGLVICLGENDGFWGARITYTYNNAGD